MNDWSRFDQVFISGGRSNEEMRNLIQRRSRSMLSKHRLVTATYDIVKNQSNDRIILHDDNEFVLSYDKGAIIYFDRKSRDIDEYQRRDGRWFETYYERGRQEPRWEACPIDDKELEDLLDYIVRIANERVINEEG